MNDSLLVAAPLMIAAIVMAVRFVGCGLAGSTDNGNGAVVSVTGDVSGRGSLSATASFPENKPATQGYTSAGTYTYEIPYGCTAIDLILLGAGGGGTYGGINNGVGGGAGSWKPATVEHVPTSLGLQQPSALRSARAEARARSPAPRRWPAETRRPPGTPRPGQ
jgi:hypothetical protein